MFSSGLLGGFGHCIGMCGPLVAAYSIPLGREAWVPHLLYNSGRIMTYSILGGLVGLAGSFTGIFSSFGSLQTIILGVIGIIMIMAGLGLAGWLPFDGRGEGEGRNVMLKAFSNMVNRMIRSVSATGGTGSFFALGMVNGFIPCGLVYTAFIGAAGAGAEAATRIEGALKGMLLLFLFGVGTSPALFLVGSLVSRKTEWMRSRLYRFSAVLMILAGLLFLYRALRQ